MSKEAQAVEETVQNYTAQRGPLLPAGYKHTELGVIPQDWDIKELMELVKFLDGERRPIKSSDRTKMRGDIPYYGASGIVDYVNDYLFDEELVLLGEDGENILSRNLPLAFRISGKAWVNNHAHVLRPNQDVSAGFLTEFLESLSYENLNSGTAQPKLNKKVCQKILIAIPRNNEEQRAIATALSDVDALLQELDRLIAKKRDIKQATMQQLLTGQTRLPGFVDAWKTKALSEIAPLQRGFDLPMSSLRHGEYPVVYSNGVTACHASSLVRGPGVITGRSGTLGRVHFVESDYWPHNTTLWVTDFKGNNPKFIYYLYMHVGFDRFSAGSGVPTLNRNSAHAFEVQVPSALEEQSAISKVLSDLDEELSALESRRKKAEQLKKGMMKELLSGGVRLV